MQRPYTAHQTALSPAGVQALAARNLELLTAIENTIDALVSDAKILRAIADAYAEVLARLDGENGEIDPTGRAQVTLQKSADACVRIYEDARQRHRSACAAPELRPDDGVTDAYEEFMDAVQALHATVEELRERIATHDAVLQPSASAVFSSVDDLFADILASK